MTIELDKLGVYDEVIVHLLIRKNTKIEFEKGNMLMLAKSQYSGEESAVHEANYLGNGKWCAQVKTPLRKKK